MIGMKFPRYFIVLCLLYFQTKLFCSKAHCFAFSFYFCKTKKNSVSSTSADRSLRSDDRHVFRCQFGISGTYPFFSFQYQYYEKYRIKCDIQITKFVQYQNVEDHSDQSSSWSRPASLLLLRLRIRSIYVSFIYADFFKSRQYHLHCWSLSSITRQVKCTPFIIFLASRHPSTFSLL